MKKVLSLLTIISLLLSSFAFCATAKSTFCPGDANGDNEVGLTDVVLIARLCAGWDVAVAENNADVNGDNLVNLKDIVLVQRYLAGGWDVVLGQRKLTFDAQTNGGTFTNGNGFSEDSQKGIVHNRTFGTADSQSKTWPANPKKYGCAFKGWFTAPTGGTQVKQSDVFLSGENIVLYAQFGGYMETPEIGI